MSPVYQVRDLAPMPPPSSPYIRLSAEDVRQVDNRAAEIMNRTARQARARNAELARPYETVLNYSIPGGAVTDEERTQSIGASEVAAVLNMSPFGNPLSVYLEKKGLAPRQEETEGMMWGKIFELGILQGFGRTSGRTCRPSRELLRSRAYPWLHYSPDGYVVPGFAATNELVEIKYSAFGHGWEEHKPPDHYYLQCQQGLLVTGLHTCHLVGHVAGRLRHFVIERDQATQDWIIQKTKEFWENHVVANVPPSLELMSEEQAREMFPVAVDDTMILPGELEKQARIAVAARKMIKLCEAAKKAAQAKLMSRMGPARRGVVGSCKIDWRNQTRTSFDQTLFKTEQPEMWERYQRPTTFRVFTIKETDENNQLQQNLSAVSDLLGFDPTPSDAQGDVLGIEGEADNGES